MKCLATFGHRVLIVGFLLSFGLASVHSDPTFANPYSAIVERNSFGLKPPVNPADLVKPPAPVVADLKLQGISTILGRKQVLMRVKVPAKPPEPAREQSFVLEEGQREGEVEVKEIDPVEGTVKVDNAGTLLALNLKDHAERPTPGAAIPTAPAGALPIPGAVPPPANPVIPRAGSSSTSTTSVEGFGGNKALPPRTIRGNEGGIASGQAGAQSNPVNGPSPLNAETAAALYIVNQTKNEQLRKSGVPLPKLPQHPLMKSLQESNGR